ncbi:MAG: FmdB family zinc ribbon protein [Chloroflexia bacterium]
MPIYEYWCPQCRTQFDKLRPLGSSDAEVKCPTCGSGVKKMVSVFTAVGRSSDEGYARPVSNGGGCACGGNCGCGGH